MVTPKPLLAIGDTPFLNVFLSPSGRHGLKHVALLDGFATAEAGDYSVMSTAAAMPAAVKDRCCLNGHHFLGTNVHGPGESRAHQ